MTMPKPRANDSVHWYMSELTSRVVAKSGIPSDRFHLGKLILQSLKDAPDFLAQIDGGTNQSETNQSTLNRSVRCANALTNFGLKKGDVMILMAPNHIDVAIPFYAALYLGIAVAAIDRTLTVKELHATFLIDKPKIIFCQSEKAPDVQLALNKLDLEAEIVTFDKGDNLCSFPKFLEKYADDITDVEHFKPTDFDTDDSIAFLITTSGTTGLPKASASTHKNISISIPYVWSRSTEYPGPTRMVMIGSPLQWLTAILHFVASPIMRFTRLQTSLSVTEEHVHHLLNTYKPTFTNLSPNLVATLIKSDLKQPDFTCLEQIFLGGSAVYNELIDEIKKITPKTEVLTVFGMTELSGLGFQIDDGPVGSCGKPLGSFQYRLVDVETQIDVTEPNKPGELWVKGPTVFKGYYNNPKATNEAFAEGWLMTGDIFYRDENWNFFFVERIKLLLKYKSYHVSPVEVENVIRQHPGVLDVAVSGVPDPECGDLPVACVVRRAGHSVTAQDIKDVVKQSLTDSKQLRGGVIFVNEIPMTASSKIDRKKLKEVVTNLKVE